jgi:hypothetical protein
MLQEYIKKLEKRILYYQCEEMKSMGEITRDGGRIAALEEVIKELQEILK